MKTPPTDERLSRITTIWTLVRQAHGKSAEGAVEDLAVAAEPQIGAAQDALVQRYSGAVHRYLLGALRDEDAADELFQEFCLRFVRGDFRKADPERGRFRDFVKTAVFHLIVDHQRRKQKQHSPLEADDVRAAEAPFASAAADREFLESWKEELLEGTWEALRQFEQHTGQPHHSVLELRTKHPNLPAEEMATQLGDRLGKTYSVPAIRKALQRAREKFADLLLEEVIRSTEGSTGCDLEDELIDLGLLSYCEAALARRSAGA